jgi:hypothetical protein
MARARHAHAQPSETCDRGNEFHFRSKRRSKSSKAHKEDLEEDRLELTCYRLRGRRDCRDDEHEETRLTERPLGWTAEHCKKIAE